MGLTQHTTWRPPHSVQRIPLPPASWRSDAVYVGLVSELAALRQGGERTSPDGDDPRG